MKWPEVVIPGRTYRANATTQVVVYERRIPLPRFALMEAQANGDPFSLWPRRRWIPKWLRRLTL